MAQFDGLPASEMAISHADRLVARLLDNNNPVERTHGLITSVYSLNDLMRIAAVIDLGSEIPVGTNILHPSFNLGVKVAIAALLDAGLDPSQLPTEHLADRARMQSRWHSAMLEASVLADGGDIRKLYFEEDGGTGGSLNG